MSWHDDVYFGLHYDLHATASDTSLGADLTVEHLKHELGKIKPDFVQCDGKGHYGYASYPTKVGMPSPGIVRDALRIHRDATAELGVPLVVHYSSIWDEAAIAKHPDWARIESDGSRSTRMVCVRSDYLRELMIPQLVEIATDYQVDGFWVDGENWGIGPCWCPRCIDEFGRSPESPRDEEWLAFHRGALVPWVSAYAAAVRDANPSCTICSNWLYSLRQPEEIDSPVDYLSGDFFFKYGSESALPEARFLDSRGIGWDLLAWAFTTAEGVDTGANPAMGWTMKTLDQLCQEASVVAAAGGALCVYNHPQRAGRLTGWHQDLLARLAEWYRARREVTIHTTSVPQVALLHNDAHYYANNHSLFIPGVATDPLKGALFSVLALHHHVDILNAQTLMTRMDEYPLVVLAEQTRLSDEMLARLRAYVEAGGRLLLTGVHIADELAGVRASGDVLDGHRYLPAGGEAVTVGGPWAQVALEDASMLLPLMSTQEEFDSLVPAATYRSLGDGAIVAVHGPLFAHYNKTHYPRTREVIRALVRALGPALAVEMDAPASVQLSLRRRDGRLLVHLMNLTTDYPLSASNVSVGQVPASGPVALRVRVPEHPTRVEMVPTGDVEWRWSDGWLHAHVHEVGIHSVLAVGFA